MDGAAVEPVRADRQAVSSGAIEIPELRVQVEVGPSPTPAPGGSLPRTGTPVALLVLVGTGLLAAGIGLYGAHRWRR